MLNQHINVLIMAGGEGTRFYPLSTPEKPKQFLNFIGDGTFIQQTRRRIASLVPPDRIYIATNRKYLSLVHEQLPEIPVENIITEPIKKNTAPCIAYISKLIHQRDEDAVLMVLPSDHVIRNENRFLDIVGDGIFVARESEYIVTLGIKPDWPATCYGYIKLSHEVRKGAFSVLAFVEKPHEEKAKAYILDGHYLWNSGMFIWRTSTILNALKSYQPEIHSLLERYKSGETFKDAFYTKAPSISVDYGIMEKASQVVVMPCDIGWSDVGTWEGLYKLHLSCSESITDEVLHMMKEELKLKL